MSDVADDKAMMRQGRLRWRKADATHGCHRGGCHGGQSGDVAVTWRRHGVDDDGGARGPRACRS